VRYLDAKGKDVLPRKDRIWSTHAVAARTIEALEAAERNVPRHLRLVLEASAPLKTATFAMHCYWVGEVQLGGLEGVIETRAAWRGHQEVVELTYDPARIEYSTLLKSAQELDCASTVFAHDDEQLATARKLVGDRAVLAEGDARPAKDSDRHYELRKSALHHVPLTPMQRTKVNAALGSNGKPEAWLSPRQKETLGAIEELLDSDAKALDEVTPAESLSQLGAYIDALGRIL
tara:strand:+ start:21764 stop:22462 length:699 start_codon:yes stop_codon:yes gene_type:complete